MPGAARFLLAGLAVGILVVVVLARRRSTMAVTGPGHRLLALWRDRSDCRFLLGMPLDSPKGWVKVANIDEFAATLHGGNQVPLDEIATCFVAYPGGSLFFSHNPTRLMFPEWVTGLEKSPVVEHHSLTPDDLREGQLLVSVSYGKSTSYPRSRNHYSTTLTNKTSQRIRVTKFGGYTKAGEQFDLNTVSARFFTAEDFQEWYNVPGEWIAPGESVTDTNNYGSPPVMWAYFCETESGQKFITGAVLD